MRNLPEDRARPCLFGWVNGDLHRIGVLEVPGIEVTQTAGPQVTLLLRAAEGQDAPRHYELRDVAARLAKLATKKNRGRKKAP